jgi:DegV family protein with EDD domain
MTEDTAGQRPVRVVTDSTADLPRDRAEAEGITVVPLIVRFGDETFLDQIELSSTEFLERLSTARELPKTSQPPVSAFETTFRGAIDTGHDVVCVTIAAGLSGTFNAARLAAEAVAPGRIKVVDSQSASMATGWCAIAAARAASGGLSLAKVVATTGAAIGRYHLYAALQTLDYLQRGGRIGRAGHLVGSVLEVKPLLTITEGEVRPLERVRTWKRAAARLVTLAQSHAPLDGLAVMHVGRVEEATRIADSLSSHVTTGDIVVSEIGPVVATYAGPGAVGVAMMGLSSERVRTE